jgi:hypothetical protein
MVKGELKTRLTNAKLGLLGGETLELQLVDQAGAREGAQVEVALGLRERVLLGDGSDYGFLDYGFGYFATTGRRWRVEMLFDDPKIPMIIKRTIQAAPMMIAVIPNSPRMLKTNAATTMPGVFPEAGPGGGGATRLSLVR